MSGFSKVGLRAVLAATTLLLVTTVLSAPAEAVNRTCASTLPSFGKEVTICVEFDSIGRPYALAGYRNASGYEPSSGFWVGLYQCNNSTGPDCILVAANDKYYRIDDTGFQVRTSSQPYSFGHTYKACTSVSTVIVNFCTRQTT